MQDAKSEINITVASVLREELRRRSHRNPQYSMRSFAASLGLSASGLSMILSGQREPSPKTLAKIADEIGLPLALKPSGFQPTKKKPVRTNEEFSIDQFALISEWYHFAILSLIELPDFVANMNWIAARLGITPLLASDAVHRLKRLKVLDTSAVPWRQMGGSILLENKIPTTATRNFQKQIIEKALTSLECDHAASRNMTSMTLAIEPADMPEAIEEIRKFRVHMMSLLEGKKKKPKEVYHLAVQFYPVTKKITRSTP